jgi:hypothetical protein
MAHPLAAAGLLLPLSFCHPPLGDASVPTGIPCTVGPPPLSAADQLTDPTARWLITVAETGKTICGWQKPAN